MKKRMKEEEKILNITEKKRERKYIMEKIKKIVDI
jgi:hypothetical protein